ncbi:MAG: sugar phosphate nucleotidyltransferase [archaeon]
MKERVTLTIDSELLEQLDKTVDGLQVKNRSHATEILLRKGMGKNTVKKALILAGGKGTRMKPITEELPKVMVPLAGKPILQHTINHLKKYGITEIILAVGYKAEKVKEYFKDGSEFGVNIKYIEEKVPLGTSGPLQLAKEYLTETFVCCNADEIKDIDVVDMYMFHKKNKATATIALTTVDDTSKFGVANLQGDKIIEFVEKPKHNPPSKLINSGFYIFEPEVLNYVPSEGPSMIEYDVFPKIAAEKKLYGYSFIGYWQELGTMESYAKAIDDIKKGKIQL